MYAPAALSLKNRITQILWVGNALAGIFTALLGAGTIHGVSGYDAQLAHLTAYIGTAVTAIGTAFAAFSLWRASRIARAS
jgi:hypothetical protein